LPIPFFSFEGLTKPFMTSKQTLLLALKWGVISATAGFLWTCFEFAVGLHDKYIDLHLYLTNLFFVFAIAITILSLSEYRKLNNGLSIGNAFLFGVYKAVVNAPLGALYFFIFIHHINPQMFENFVAMGIQYHLKDGKTLAEATKEANAYFNYDSYMQKIIVGGFVGPIVVNLIAGVFMRTKKKQAN